MIEVPLIDDLREVRRELSEEHGLDVRRYADMLRAVAQRSPGEHVTRPLVRLEGNEQNLAPALPT